MRGWLELNPVDVTIKYYRGAKIKGKNSNMNSKNFNSTVPKITYMHGFS